MQAAQPSYKITYNTKDITQGILPYVISLTYSDKTGGDSDELEIVLEDKDGLWRGAWYPQKEDSIDLQIMNLGDALDCGTFTIDEISGSGSDSGNTLSIKALAAGINKNIRTKRSQAHESKSLREIINTIASRNHLTVIGNIPNITLARKTQYRDKDSHFLKRIANEYGFEASIRDGKLIFTSLIELENQPPGIIFTPDTITSWSITDKTADTYQTAKFAYHNPQQAAVISSTQAETNPAYGTVKVDDKVIRGRAENTQQAEIKAQMALYRANSLIQEGSLEMPGNVFAVAGITCELDNIGMFSGIFYIKSSTHTVSKDDGYTTSLEIKKVKEVDKSKQ